MLLPRSVASGFLLIGWCRHADPDLEHLVHSINSLCCPWVATVSTFVFLGSQTCLGQWALADVDTTVGFDQY